MCLVKYALAEKNLSPHYSYVLLFKTALKAWSTFGKYLVASGVKRQRLFAGAMKLYGLTLIL